MNTGKGFIQYQIFRLYHAFTNEISTVSGHVFSNRPNGAYCIRMQSVRFQSWKKKTTRSQEGLKLLFESAQVGWKRQCCVVSKLVPA